MQEDPKTPTLNLPSALADKKILSTQAPVYAALLVGGIIIGVFLATGWSSFKTGGVLGEATSTAGVADTAGSTSVKTTLTPASSSDLPLVVNDQRAGGSVVIATLSLAKPTWVVVYVSREGKPGNALGARLFYPGDSQGQVGLLRDTAAGQSYFVGLSVDNGDRVFSLTKDKPVADADGGPLWETFTAR